MMPALLEPLRRLFPPLKVRSKLLTSMVLLSIYGLARRLAI